MNKNSGFSLLELLLAMVIVGVLMMMAYPSYLSYVRKGYRAEAITYLTRIQLAQESWRATHTTYGSLANVLGSLSIIPSGRYTLSVNNVTALGYTATAVAVGDQTSDVSGMISCANLTLTMNNTVVTTEPSACWL